MLARLIYGFRISVLFGLILTIISSVIGVAAGAVQGYFGGWVDLFFQRFIEIWTSVPSLYLLLIISSVLVPSFFVLLGILLLFSWVSLVGLVRAEFLRGRNFEYVQAARALGVSNCKIMFRHLLPNAMVATLTFLPFILSASVDDADLARLPRLRPAARLAVARRIAVAGQGQSSGAVARPVRLLHHRDHAVAADLHRRGGARRLRSAQDLRDERRAPRFFASRISPSPSAGRARGRSRSTASRSTSSRGETVALVGESGSGKSVTALSVMQAAALSGGHPSDRHDPVQGQGPADAAGARDARRCAATTSP